MKFTREQSLALTQDRHLAVTANAGSGKTRVLVEKYIDIIINDSPKAALAITFTRKAAAEMRSRVVEDIEARLIDTKYKADWKKIRNIREKLTNAEISTIHSFCSQLLKEFPIEANISPAFIELSESELAVIIRDSILNVSEEWLTNSDNEKKNSAFALFKLFGQKKIEDYLSHLYNNRYEANEILALYSAKTNQEIILAIKHSFFKEIVSDILSSFRKLLRIAEGFDCLENKETGQLNDFINGFNDVLSSIDKAIKNLDFDELIDSITTFNALQKQKISRKNSTNYVLGRIYEKSVADEFAQHIQDFSSLQQLIPAFENESDMINNARTLLNIYKDVENEIESRKQEAGAMDFEDMLLLAGKLINDPEVCRWLRMRYKHILVDEFQDTNPIQWKIIKNLIESFNDNTGGAKLFIVGDEKQSIYGFRNADIRIFNSAREEIESANISEIKTGSLLEELRNNIGVFSDCSPKEKAGSIKLLESFRMAPAPAAFINSVCSNFMKSDCSVYDVDYDELIYAKNNPDIQNYDTDRRLRLSEEFGTVEILLNIVDNGEKNTDKSNEAVLLAKRLKNIVLNKEKKVYCNDGERPVCWSDIAVLVRNRNRIGTLVEKFVEYGIPYSLHAGSGFFNTQEILDIRNFLSFLHNSGDNTAAAAVFKSPFFSLSDTLLFQINTIKDGASFWEKLKLYSSGNYLPDNSEIQKFNLKLAKRASDIIESLFPLSGRLPIAQLISRILDDTGWYGCIAQSPNRRQIEANVGKLVDFARSYGRKGFKTLHDFLSELALLAEKSKEPEAAFISGENAVNVMTMHSAKGLEFPITVLFDTSHRTANPDRFQMNSDIGLIFPNFVEEGDFGEFGEISAPSHFIARKRVRKAEQAEEKRVFYVAMTRAKDHLIISASIISAKNGYVKPAAFFKLLLNGLKRAVDEIAEIDNNDCFSIETKLRYLTDNGAKSIDVEIPVSVIISQDDIATNEIALVQRHNIPAFILEDVRSEIEDRFFSATQLLTFLKDPEEYELRYFLGLPSKDDSHIEAKYHEPDAEDDKTLATLAGTLIHSALERIDSWLFDGKPNLKALEETVKSILTSIERAISQKLYDRIINECLKTASTSLIINNFDSIKKAKKEYSLTLPLENNFIVGTLDMLIINNSDEYEIWDWKTNRISQESDINALAEYYKTQMQFYAYLTIFLNPKQEEITARLLFTRLAKENVEDDRWTRVFTWNRNDLMEYGAFLKGVIKQSGYLPIE